MSDLLPQFCESRRQTEAEFCVDVQKALEEMSGLWFESESPSATYCEPEGQIGYICCHMPLHAAACQHALYHSGFIDNIIESERDYLKIVSLGGGPGTELLGLYKLIQKSVSDENRIINVDFDILDSNTGWAEICDLIHNTAQSDFDEEYESTSLNVNLDFREVNFENDDEWVEVVESISDSDIFIFNYSLSELDSEDIINVLKRIVSVADNGAEFIIIDRNEERLSDLLDKFMQQRGIKCIYDDSFTFQMPTEEDKRELGEYLAKIDRFPKLGADIFIRIFEK